MGGQIKLIIFDLDGVLVDSKDLHYESFNAALAEIDPKYVIPYDEHLDIYDGLSTDRKLEILTAKKQLDPSLHGKIWQLKQKKTIDFLLQMKPDERIISILKTLKDEGYILYCATNSVWKTAQLILSRKGFLDYLDYFISNEDVRNIKPYPDLYLECCKRAKVSPHETLVLEDSHVGQEAVIRSCCHLCPIINSSDVTLEKIREYLNDTYTMPSTVKWQQPILPVVVMAGYGTRFQWTHKLPKPLIDVKGVPMIKVVVDNLAINSPFIFIVRKEHMEDYPLEYILKTISPHCKLVVQDEPCKGAASSVLLAKDLINNDTPLLIANSDQYLEWNSSEFLKYASADSCDGCISTFYCKDDPKWSYARTNELGLVIEVQEKKCISTSATTGIYYWKRGKDFVKYAEQMINKNIKVNNEYYVCPVYNEAIADGLKIRKFDCKRMWGLGDPDDLELYLNFKYNFYLF